MGCFPAHRVARRPLAFLQVETETQHAEPVPTAQRDQVYETLHTHGTGDFIPEAFGTHVSEREKKKERTFCCCGL
jgi:hypothetical protein